MSGPGTSDVDDFNNFSGPHPYLKSIPKILEKNMIIIPTVRNRNNEFELIHCGTCVPAYAYPVFIINDLYLLKWDDAVKEARRIRWGQK